MNIITVILCILLIIMTIQYLRYRRQIRNICRQMSFMEKQETNRMITTSCSGKEILELAEHINDLNDFRKNQVREYKLKDERLKEAITNLSHDIRTPLTSLNGYFQLMQDSDNEAEREHYGKIIEGRIDSLQNLLEELFTYTKLQNDSYELDLEKVNITRVVCENIFSFYEEFKLKNITPKAEVDDSDAWVMCNQTAVGRIIHNIVKNALSHGKDEIELQIKQENKKFIFICKNKVENPQEIDIDQVFTRFYRADSARRGVSTGLGLAIAKELTECMHGKIAAGLEGEIFSIRIEFEMIADFDCFYRQHEV